MTTNKPEVVMTLLGGEQLIRLSDYERLQADRDQQYDMKVKAREQRDAVTAKLKALQTECEKLRRRARAAEREYSKVARTLKDLERVAKVVSDNSDAVCGENNQLQAELEHLRKDADRIDWLADPSNSIGNVQLPIAVVRQHLHSLRDAIDAAMQEPTK